MVWGAIFFAYLLISLALYFFLPLIGLILFYLIDPIFVAGFMIGFKALENSQELEIGHLFSAFKQNASRLVTIGGINLVGRIIIFGLMGLMFVNSGYEPYLDMVEKGNYDRLFSAGMEAKFLVWLLALTSLMLPMYMAYWFSPALVEFDDIEPFDAMRLSVKGCLRNAKAFLMYGISFLAVVIAFFLTVSVIGALLGLFTVLLGNGIALKIFIGSVGLVLALLCWAGVQVLLAATQYVSYRTIFRTPEESDGMMAL